MSNEPQKKGFRISWPLAFVLMIALVVGSGMFVAHRIDRQITNQTDDLKSLAQRVHDAFVSVATVAPVIKINQQVFFEKDQPLLELAVMSRDQVVELDTTSSFLGSTKRYRSRGFFTVKAGFNLNEPVDTSVFTAKDGTQTIRIVLPTPKILSVEQTGFERLQLDDGIWNKITPKDIDAEVRGLQAQARETAENSQMPDEAVELLATQMASRLGQAVEILVRPAADAEPIPSPVPGASPKK